MGLNENNPVLQKNTLEFAAVALEYCAFIEQTQQQSKATFVDRMTKLLPLLYMRTLLLPEVEEAADFFPEYAITEFMYDSVKSHVSSVLGEDDAYLETVHPDMQYSDTPIASFISEQLADIYQDLGNFVALYRQGEEEIMEGALAQCKQNFDDVWGQCLVNALRALHMLRGTIDETETDENTAAHNPWGNLGYDDGEDDREELNGWL